MSSPATIYGYRVELILADNDGGTFVVPNALKRSSERVAGVLVPSLVVDHDQVMAAINDRNLQRRKPLFREVKLTDAP